MTSLKKPTKYSRFFLSLKAFPMYTPWLKNYPEHVAHQIDETEHQSLVDLYEKSFNCFAAQRAFVNMDKKLPDYP